MQKKFNFINSLFLCFYLLWSSFDNASIFVAIIILKLTTAKRVVDFLYIDVYIFSTFGNINEASFHYKCTIYIPTDDWIFCIITLKQESRQQSSLFDLFFPFFFVFVFFFSVCVLRLLIWLKKRSRQAPTRTHLWPASFLYVLSSRVISVYILLLLKM